MWCVCVCVCLGPFCVDARLLDGEKRRYPFPLSTTWKGREGVQEKYHFLSVARYNAMPQRRNPVSGRITLSLKIHNHLDGEPPFIS